MNILRKIVKETVLIPMRVMEGALDAIDYVANGPTKEPEDKKEK